MKQNPNLLKESKVQSLYSQDLNSKSLTNENKQDKKSTQPTSVDLKKINLNKDPKQANSSLQLLILLLSKCLKMSLEEILGLFTNQNKYLAHIIVKGINQNFTGIRSFYQQLNNNIQTLQRLYYQDQDDAFACFYAIKPGFISKDEIVAQFTIKFFKNFNSIYDWFVSPNSKCCNTLLLGFKRHQILNPQYALVLFSLIQGNQIDFYTNHFRKNISGSVQFLTIVSKLAKFIGKRTIMIQKQEKSLPAQLQKSGVFQSWLQLSEELYEGGLEDKLLVLQFLGELMLWLPEIIEKNQMIFNSIRQNWKKYEIIIFAPLLNQLLIILQKLAEAKSKMSKKLYLIVVDIFNDTYQNQDKREYIVNSFMSIISQFPSIPSDIFIKNYQLGKLNSSDFLLICEAIDISSDPVNLIKIGQILRDIFFYDVLINFYLATLITQIVKKVIKFHTKQIIQFLNNLVKFILTSYVGFTIKLKSMPKNSSDEAYFGKKKSLQKSGQNQKKQSTQLNKRLQITINLCESIIDTVIAENIEQNYLITLKNYVLVAHAEIKKNNFGIPNKRIMTILQKKLSLTKEEQVWFEQQNKQNLQKSGIRLTDSVFTKKSKDNYSAIASLSRIQVPQKITKQFDQIIAKRKKDEQNKVYEQMKKKKEEQQKKIIYKKQLQKMNLIKGGFGEGQAHLKQEGFWSKFIKQNQEIKVYTNEMVEDSYLDAAELILKKYNKLLKYFFINYSSTMYSVRATNFDENQLRKQTLSTVEIIKFLKDYKLIFMTNSQEVQNLVRQINVKILGRKQIVNELDFEGFQQFIRQFCLCLWSQNQIDQNKNSKIKLNHLSLPELINNLIFHLKGVFGSKGQNMSFFQAIQVEHESITSQAAELNQKLRQNPSLILPKDYKKIVDKKIQFNSSVNKGFKVNEGYMNCLQVLDDILFQKFSFHIIQPSSLKVTKVTAKLFHQISVRERDPTKIKVRALSTIIDRKMVSQSSLGTYLTKNDLSKGLKKAMLLLKNQDKIIGQQVALTIQQLLLKIDPQNQNKTNLMSKVKDLSKYNPSEKPRGSSHRRLQSVGSLNSQKIDGINQLRNTQKIKRQLIQRKLQRQQEEKKRIEQQKLKVKRKKQIEQRYYQEQRKKLEQKKRIQHEQERKKRSLEKPSKAEKKKMKQTFEQFNQKRVQKLKRDFEQTADRRKKQEEDKQVKIEQKQENMKKIRNKIQSQDKIISQIRKQTLETIIQISFSQPYQSLIRQYQQPLQKIFEYLQKNTFKPLADKKCKPNQIDYESWLKFNKIFQLSPLIVNPKDVISIFKAVTKDKRVAKQYLVGLTYDQFLQSLLRQCIKQKTIFSKLTERIRDQQPVQPQVNTKKQKITPKVQNKNQFDEDEQVDIKSLLKEPDVRDDIIDHYGDLTKFNIQYFKGLVYYLRMPFTKKGQQKRIKQLIQKERQPEAVISNIQKLKQKLKMEYTLQRVENKQKSKAKVIQSKEQPSIKQKTETKSKKSQKK